MYSFQFVQQAKELNKSIADSKLLSRLTSLSENLDRVMHIFESVINISPKSTKCLEIHKEADEHIQEWASHILRENIKQFYSDILNVELMISDIKGTKFITEKIESFSSDYESFIRNRKKMSVFYLLISANELRNALFGFKDALIFIDQNLRSTPDGIKDELEELSLFFTSSMSLSAFIMKLSAIDNIYSEVCELLNISSREYPIQISKIESGSLWADILGYPKVIALLTSLVESSVSYLHRNFTKEGKISSIPKKAEHIESIIKLSKKLEEQGVDVSEINDNLQKACVVISKNLNSLLAGEPTVTINNKTYSIEAEMRARQIESTENKLLETDNSLKS